MEKFIKDKEVITADAEPSVVGWINKKDKETFILDSITGENFFLTHTNDPEFSEDGEKVRVVGIPKLINKMPLGDDMISALIPFLETKFEHGESITLKKLPFKFMTEKVKIIDHSHYGDEKLLANLDDDNAVIVWIGNNGTIAVLTSDEHGTSERGIFVFKDTFEAMLAIQAFRVYPPYKDATFYENAEVVKLSEVDKTNLGNERFIYFDQWMKCVANLSNHMVRGGAKPNASLEERKKLAKERTKTIELDSESERLLSLKIDISEKKVYARKIKKPLANGCKGCAFKHVNKEGRHDGCHPWNQDCTPDVKFTYIYKIAKNPNYKPEVKDDYPAET